ncbi:BaiN/RdsA family NAD(P)/FAD-dependent oxidoreductase [Desulfovibrio falkowii]|uniref:NAD(P)/FAD-dependent oxidoreductase n=1 Tax=Desulfovibrio falkowii TaxID=3136602 RepID=A0ABQ0E7A0_9BACT
MTTSSNPVPAPARVPYGLAGTKKHVDESQADVLVLGAGASGLICAREAAGRGLRVTVLERGAVPARKLAISGGGKANFTNRRVTSQGYRCDGPEGSDFCAPALQAFAPAAIQRMVRQWRLPFEEREHGQLFLTVPAQKLVQALMTDCRQRGCRIEFDSPVETLNFSDGIFVVHTPARVWRAPAVVLAMGSPAWPQAGGSGHGYRLAQQLGHSLVPPCPALTPLLLPQGHILTSLSGISLPVRISAETHHWQDHLLFTHSGLSGPAALKASLFWESGMQIRVNFLPDRGFKALLDAPEAGKQTPRTLLGRLLPQRLADALLPQENARKKIAELSRATRNSLVESVHAHSLLPVGAAGLKKAEACRGGVQTGEINAQTMQSRLCPGLFITGELLDVTGLLGGYNLHWAWASGMAAGKALPLPAVQCGS